MTTKPLSVDKLCQYCDPNQFSFETTADLEPLADAIGQARAVEAVRFGIGMESEGYNLYAMGPAETGKHTVVRGFLEQRAKAEKVPPDVCYLNNFKEPHRPRALQLPPGQGNVLRTEMAQLVEELRTAIPAAFESDEYRTRKQAVEEELKEQHDRALGELRDRAQAANVALIRTPVGFALAPMRNGEVLSPAEFQALPEAERTEVEAQIERLQEQLRAVLEQVPLWEKSVRTKMKQLVRDVTVRAVGHLIGELRTKHATLPGVVAYLTELEQDVVDHVDDFIKPAESAPSDGELADLGATTRRAPLRRYQVNVLVDHVATEGAPVVHEDYPTYQNLVGRIEHLSQFGALVTDFLLVKPGALHRANGGYLVVEAHKLLMQPYAWEGLKRALQSHEIRMDSLGQLLSLVSTVSLEPEPIPLRVKVVLLGERSLLYLLDQLDPEFRVLFKVAVDFEEEVARTEENNLLYARMLGSLAKNEKLCPLDRGAVARVLDRGARLVGDAEKLSAHAGSLAALVREADYWARQARRSVITREDVTRAIKAQEVRLGRIRERVLEEIHRGTFRIDTDGAAVGQVNGLAVMQIGQLSFGRPNRITAKVRLGKGEVVDIEREVKLGGPIHSKGVLILSGFVGARYALDHPLSLSATIVFEQSYSMVEGDSASSAELYALLSAISGVPLRQTFAVTGSVNQHGEVQAIGGVNEKVEGFFDVCRARGLTGAQGVVIPAANVVHLMLRDDVVDAVRNGQFAIYAVSTIDEGIELLTGVPAGVRDDSGKFTEGSINAKVEARLVALWERRAALASAMKEQGA